VWEVNPLFTPHLIFLPVGKADGTYLAYGPDRNLPTLLGWLAALPPDRPT
jgi:hypothetical protein